MTEDICGEPALVPPKMKNVPPGGRPGRTDRCTSTPPLTAALYDTSGIVRAVEPLPSPLWNPGAAKSRLAAPPVAAGRKNSFHVSSAPYPIVGHVVADEHCTTARPTLHG